MQNKNVTQQQTIWETHTAAMTEESIIDSINSPSIPNMELADYLNGLLKGVGKTIEVGCESGTASFLLKCEERCFFDLNGDIIEKDKRVHDRIQPDRKDMFVQGDMFSMPFPDGAFDLVFNAGVLEHYLSDELVLALKEMGRVSKGTVVVAIPNHYCYVYRLAYLIGMLLDHLGIKKWKYPPEFKYYDCREEIERAGLTLRERKVISKASIWNWWTGRWWFFPARAILKAIDKIYPSEGYLTVLLIDKNKGGVTAPEKM